MLLCGSLILGTKVRDRLDASRGKVFQSIASENASSELAASNQEPIAGLVASRQKDTGGINLDAYYDEVEEILKMEYVDPIKDEQKLAIGAVRGMVSSLGDPKSQYMEKDAFTAYQQAQEGRFAGIGVDFYLQPIDVDLAAGDTQSSDTDPTSDFVATRIPRLVVSTVVPGGPADKAGVKPGDWVDTVNGHWVIDSELIAKYRKLAVGDPAAKTPAAKAELEALRRSIRDRAEAAIMPLRALALLSLGSHGKVTVVWNRAGAPQRTVDMEKASVTDVGNVVSGGVIKLRFGKDAPDFLRSAISNKSTLTIDLRNQPEGYFDSMVGCLQAIAPSGTYGSFTTQRKGQHPAPFVLQTGNANPPKVTLLVDHTVRGPAAIFALALNSKGLAQLQGSEVSDDRSRIMIEGLPDGSGYTLVTGEYQATQAVAARTKGAKS